MNTVREYRMPLMIGAATLVVALLLWAVLVSPQNSKLSSLQTQETTAADPADHARRPSWPRSKTEKQKLSSQLRRPAEDRHPDPERAEPDRHRRRGVVVREPVQRSDGRSGVTLTQFSGFAPATTAQAPDPDATRPPGAPAERRPAWWPVPTTLAVTGNYSQISAFINGLDSFPRLFVIQTFMLVLRGHRGDQRRLRRSSAPAPRPPASAAGAPRCGPAGRRRPPAAGPYSLAITGSIYYTSTPNALAACTKATAAVH